MVNNQVYHITPLETIMTCKLHLFSCSLQFLWLTAIFTSDYSDYSSTLTYINIRAGDCFKHFLAQGNGIPQQTSSIPQESATPLNGTCELFKGTSSNWKWWLFLHEFHWYPNYCNGNYSSLYPVVSRLFHHFCWLSPHMPSDYLTGSHRNLVRWSTFFTYQNNDCP